MLAVVGCLCVCGFLEAAPQLGNLVEIGTVIDSFSVTTEEPSTTTDLSEKLAAVYTSKTPKLGQIAYSAGVHRFEIGPDEDSKERLLQEYRDKFELRLPSTTARYPKGPPCIYC
uniref:Putative secreted peptide n=1 Tax=Anopheles braziliensis TaxID=58242 RepID=A0A2M3ZVX1_9DIPT